MKGDEGCDLKMRTHLRLKTRQGNFSALSRLAEIQPVQVFPWASPGLIRRRLLCAPTPIDCQRQLLAFPICSSILVPLWLYLPMGTASAWYKHSSVLARGTHRGHSQRFQLEALPVLCRRGWGSSNWLEAQKNLALKLNLLGLHQLMCP